MKIIKCSCRHEYQDSIYGQGNRAHNTFHKNNGGYRCTVCNGEKRKSDGEDSKVQQSKKTNKK